MGLPVNFFAWFMLLHLSAFADSLETKISADHIYYAASKARVYDFVTVEQVSASSPYKDLHFETSGYPAELAYRIRFENGSEWLLNLELNVQLIPDKFQFLHQSISKSHDQLNTTNTEIEMEVSTSLQHCFYHGHLVGGKEENTMAAMSTCNGLRGTIIVNGEFYIMQPTDRQNPSTYFVYSVRDELPHPYHACGTETDLHPESRSMESLFKEVRDHSRMRRVIFSKFIELYIILDNSLFQRISSNLAMSRQYAIDIANQMDLMYKTIGVRVAIVGIQVWNVNDFITVDRDLSITLTNWISYLPTLKSQTSFTFDNAQLIIGLEFPSNNVIGQATVGTMCFSNSGGVNRDTLGNNALRIASTVSHEMGHNLGMQHDEARSCYVACSSGNGCIMNAVSSGQPATMFSPCSVQDLNTNLENGVGFCIFNEPTMLATDPACGNGFIETGEECDCGPIATCATVDPCCEPGLCVLKQGASCATGECCENCQFRNPSVLCRQSGNTCDLDEFCTGSSSLCPNNRFKRDGLACTRDAENSFCYKGDCKTLANQCDFLWGSTSLIGADRCFNDLNVRGDQFGYCSEVNGTFTACALSDVKCGKLHCTNISQSDFQLSGSIQFTQVTFGSTLCKSASIDVGNDVPDPGIVFDGSPCDTDSICISQRCTTIASLNFPSCPSSNGMECSGNGVCTNEIMCLCNSGYGGADCSAMVTIPPSQSTQPTQPTQSAQPPQPTQSMQPTQPTQSMQPTQPTQSMQPTQPTQSMQPTQTTQSVTNTTGAGGINAILMNVYFQVGVSIAGVVLLFVIFAFCLLCVSCIIVKIRKNKMKEKYQYNPDARSTNSLSRTPYSPVAKTSNINVTPANYPAPTGGLYENNRPLVPTKPNTTPGYANMMILDQPPQVKPKPQPMPKPKPKV